MAIGWLVDCWGFFPLQNLDDQQSIFKKKKNSKPTTTKQNNSQCFFSYQPIQKVTITISATLQLLFHLFQVFELRLLHCNYGCLSQTSVFGYHKHPLKSFLRKREDISLLPLPERE